VAGAIKAAFDKKELPPTNKIKTTTLSFGSIRTTAKSPITFRKVAGRSPMWL
jgi:hypothetical protein